MIFDHVIGVNRIFQYASPKGLYHARRVIEPNVEEIEVIVAGRGRFLVGDEFVEVGPGGMLWYYPGDVVEVTSHSAEPYNTIVFVFQTDGRRAHECRTLEHWRDPEACAAFCATMLRDSINSDKDELLALTCYSRLAWEARQYKGVESPQLHPAVGVAREYIQHHYLNPNVKAMDIAQAAGVSVSHLHLLFRQNSPVSPMHMVAELRLERARVLLKSTDLPVKNVALESGFSDFNHFCRYFRQRVGSSPGKFRDARL